jgi:predicted GH43/DUF377 family glycosyl hydrolase
MRAGRAFLLFASIGLTGCGNYRDFTLPVEDGGPAVHWQWHPDAEPVLTPGASGEWDAVDVLNPSVLRRNGEYWNLFSGFDGKIWHTGLAISSDGIAWRKQGKILSPDPATWEGNYIAANGSAIDSGSEILYYYQAGSPPRIGLARASGAAGWHKQARPVLDLGPYGSWDERGVADPYLFHAGDEVYLFYVGMDRARRQRLGVAVSDDYVTWHKLRSNPILELGEYGAFDENGLGEPAIWASDGYYWLLYTGRDRREYRRLGLARSRDGVHWEKLPDIFAGGQPWDSKVICDPSVLIEGNQVRVWFGGGDVARPDENLHGRIGAGVLERVRTD